MKANLFKNIANSELTHLRKITLYAMLLSNYEWDDTIDMLP